MFSQLFGSLVQFVIFSCLSFLYQATLGLGAAFATHLTIFSDPSVIVILPPAGATIVGPVGAVNETVKIIGVIPENILPPHK